MVLWRCELRVSWRAQWQSLLLHGVIILLLLLAPWPGSYTLLWVGLLILIVMECVRSQRRILARVGPIELMTAGQIRWRQQRWSLASRPWLSRWMILLSLRGADGKRERLWLFADCMGQAEWRLLRQQLLMQKELDIE